MAVEMGGGKWYHNGKNDKWRKIMKGKKLKYITAILVH